MTLSKPARIALRVIALSYLIILLAVPIIAIVWRTFEPGLGAFWASIRTPAAISALNLSLLIVAIVSAGSRSGLYYASIPDTTPELIEPARDLIDQLKVTE